jgi:hypothetical protein
VKRRLFIGALFTALIVLALLGLVLRTGRAVPA